MITSVVYAPGSLVRSGFSSLFKSVVRRGRVKPKSDVTVKTEPVVAKTVTDSFQDSLATDQRSEEIKQEIKSTKVYEIPELLRGE